MDIGAMRIRILFQKQTAGVDEYRNHVNTWEDYFGCWATASYSSGDETNEAGQTVTQESMDFTCRYCSERAGSGHHDRIPRRLWREDLQHPCYQPERL